MCFGLKNLYRSTYQKYCPSEASYQLGQCPLWNQEIYLKHHFEVSWSIWCVWLSYWWGHWQACFYKVPFCIISGDEQWFDASCQESYDTKQIAYHAWCWAHNADHWGLFLLARAEAQKVYGAARESHNECTRNTLKHSTSSCKWRETLKGSVFGVKPSIPALIGPRGGLVVATSEKVSVWQQAVWWAVCHPFVLFPLF